MFTDDLAAEASDAGNLMKIVFNVFISGGTVGQNATVGAGISIGTVKIWTCLMDLKILAADPITGSSIESLV